VVHYRTIWLSDLHLGTRGCNADLILDFLRHNESDVLYLVGDIIDCWHLKRRWYWPQTHNDICQKILRKVRKGTRVIFIPGNHDESMKPYCGHMVGGIEIHHEVIHEMQDGRHFLVLHGDRWDEITTNHRWLAVFGDIIYHGMLAVHHWNSWIRRMTGLGHWSLAGYIKHRVKEAVQYISNFEEAAGRECAERGLDGIICGHIHHAEIRSIGSITYFNDGDGVESCTTLVETNDGRMQLLDYHYNPPKLIAEEYQSIIAKA
jgi:UDP-2,3-diacylglucosamine pyrophosphatase LpxH